LGGVHVVFLASLALVELAREVFIFSFSIDL